MGLTLRDAADARNSITEEEERQIRKLYEDWAKQVGETADYYHRKTTPSSSLQEANLRQLQNQLTRQSQQISNKVNGIVREGMYRVADSTIASTVDWMKGFGFDGKGLSAMFTSVPDDVVHRLVTGQVYDSGWSLSKAIWSDNEKTLQDIYTIVAAGRAQNLPIYDVAKRLQQYVNPQKAKDWNPLIKMKNTQTGQYEYKRIYKSAVDYNAQRLARTLAQHTYQQTLVSAAAKNPFVNEFIWWANGSRACAECEERDGHRFKAAELPLDHPNGMCVMEPVVDEDKMIDQLADWVSSPDGTFPEIDQFASTVGYTPTTTIAQASNLAQAAINSQGSYDTWSVQKLEDVASKLPVNQEDNEDGRYAYGLYIDTNQSNVINNFLREAADQGMDPLDYLESIKDRYTAAYYEQMKEAIPALDRAFSSYELESGLETHRFVKSDFLDNTFGSRRIGDIKAQIGSQIENAQYLSSTVVSHDSFGNRSCMLTIQADAGTKCLPTTNYKEGEVVFGRQYDFELVEVNKYSGKNPLTMETPSGATVDFKGLELVVRLVEGGAF